MNDAKKAPRRFTDYQLEPEVLKALERLRERRYSTWRIESERESQAEMDEMGRVRHLNLRREGAEE